MNESQHIEHKRLWKDEWMKELCAFANAQGGTLCLGLDDDGTPVGLPDAQRLMEELPNKISLSLGLVCDLRLRQCNEKEIIEISVPSSTAPISYHGAYYLRSGSTKQELRGSALQQFLLHKFGRSWDDMPHETATLDCIDRRAVDYFLRHAAASGRISSEMQGDDTAHVLENLRLLSDDGLHPRYAALLLFAKDPLRFFPGVSFRIGRFGREDCDLMFQDVVEGNILQMADRVIDVLRSKYLISPIRYEGLQRIEELEIPEAALRELLCNAIVHKQYPGVHIQMRVYNDHIDLWNPGPLPEGITLAQLHQTHGSHARNQLVADTFYKAGFIEAWGRGISKVRHAFLQAGLLPPTYQEREGGMLVTIPRPTSPDEQEVVTTPSSTPQEPCKYPTRAIQETSQQSDNQSDENTLAHTSTPQEPYKYPTRTIQVMRLINCLGQSSFSLKTISQLIGLSNRPHLLTDYIQPALAQGYVEMTHPENPKHRKQAYRLTKKGLALWKELNKDADTPTY